MDRYLEKQKGKRWQSLEGRTRRSDKTPGRGRGEVDLWHEARLRCM